VEPALALEIARIRSTLEEREREDHARFKQLLRRRKPVP
jgi:vacuolar-type H+-ATPase subunit D/Vma8